MKTARSTVDAVTSVAASMQPTRISGVQESTSARNFIFSHTHTHTYFIFNSTVSISRIPK